MRIKCRVTGVIWMLIFLGGCQVMEKEEAGGEMLEYSIVDEKKVPAEMTERIAGMEETPFQIMYVQGDRLYVGQGYGRQEMEGYAIRVDGCTEEKDVICVQTTPPRFDLLFRLNTDTIPVNCVLFGLSLQGTEPHDTRELSGDIPGGLI